MTKTRGIKRQCYHLAFRISKQIVAGCLAKNSLAAAATHLTLLRMQVANQTGVLSFGYTTQRNAKT